MNCYKLIVSYDGTDFFGWQSQKHCRTIQSAMEDAFVRAFHKSCKIFAASRTDAGVHARYQVVSLRTDLSLDAGKMRDVFNLSLPDAIRVETAELVDDFFNPQANVDFKIYEYRIFMSKASPTRARYGWYPHDSYKVDWKKFEECMSVFVGKHNFLPFCRIEKGEDKVVVRRIDSVSCRWPNFQELLITIKSHSFLRYQIRRMIGAAFEVARKRGFDKEVLLYSLKTGKHLPPQITFNAPPKGLCLEKIVYRS